MNVCLYASTERWDLISWRIRRETNCDWSHVGFYDLDRQMTFSAMCDGRGVTWRPLKRCQKVMLFYALGTDAALECALAEEGKSYDMLDIVGIAFGANLALPDRFICSTLVLWAFEQTGNPLLNMKFIPLSHLTPRDVLLSPKITPYKELLDAR